MPVPPFPHLTIVHATERYAVIDKPSGLLSVPGKGEANQDCVPARVRALFPAATGPLTVHRLDMDTSGLIVVGLDPDAQRDLSIQFESRHVEKAYTALVDGHVRLESGTVSVPIRTDYANRPYQLVDPSHHRPAITAYKVLAYEPAATRLELIPLTGRTHQLRVHCAYGGPGGLRGPAGDPSGRGHPILGDVLYGPPWIDHADAPDRRLALHAHRLTFTDPATGRRTEYTTPPPF